MTQHKKSIDITVNGRLLEALQEEKKHRESSGTALFELTIQRFARELLAEVLIESKHEREGNQ
jgi:hypothetical protein